MPKKVAFSMEFRVFSLSVLLVLTSASPGAIQANVVSGPSGTTATSTETSPGSGVYNVVLTRPSTPANTTDAVFTVTRTSSSDKIGTLEVKSQQSLATARFAVGTNTARIAEIGSIKYGTGTNDKDGWAFLEELWTTQSVGDIDVSKIGVANIGGSLTGNVLVRAVENGTPEIVDLGVGSSILGDITVQDNTLYGLQGILRKVAIIDDAGKEPGVNEVAIRAAIIKDIIVGNSFYGVIEGATPGSYARSIHTVDIGDGGTGNFEGVVRVGGFESTSGPFFRVRDDFIGTLAISEAFDADEVHPSRTPFIQTGIGGLKGQILINTEVSPFSQSWTAPVKIGPDFDPAQIILAGPTYTATSSQLGGGDVGLLPLGFHGTDCSPQEGTTRNDLISNITASFDGPVIYASDTPLVVMQRKVGGSGDFVDLTSCVTFSRPGDARDITLAKLFWPVGDYVVNIAAGVLKNEVFGSPVGDAGPSIYSFSIRRACQGDLNGDNVVNTADLTMLLGQFGQSSPCGAARDLDGDLAVNTIDLTIFLGRFGTTCDGSRPGAPVTTTLPIVTKSAAGTGVTTGGSSTTEAMRGGEEATPLPPVLAALGFTSVEQYTAWVDTLTREQLDAHIVQLLQAIETLNTP